MPDKLCPMRKKTFNSLLINENRQQEIISTAVESSSEEFLPCLGKECAWWNGDDCAVLNGAYALTNIEDKLGRRS